MIQRNPIAAVLDAAANDPGDVLIFCEINHPAGWVRVHSGVGERTYNGVAYLGVGELGGVGTIKENAQKSALRLNLSLKITDVSLLGQVMNEDCNHSEVYLHAVALDENRRIVGGYDYFFDGEIVNTELDTGDLKNDVPAVLYITCSDFLERWSEAPTPELITDAAQQHAYPGDKIFDQVEIIAGSPLHALPFKTGGRSNNGGGRDGRRRRPGMHPD